MRNLGCVRHLLSLTLLLAVSTLCTKAQSADPDKELLNAKVSKFVLQNGTLFAGIAQLSAEAAQISFAFEFILTAHPHDPPTSEVLFNVHLENRTIREILDTLCRFDDRYSWDRDGTMVNVYPKETVNDGSYLMNRKLPKVELRGVAAADDALFAAVSQLPPPFEQIAVAQAGGNISYPAPWNATLENLTLRQVLNLIARNIAPQGGWVLSGSREFRTIGFHNRRIHGRQPGAE
jgi:hypothetical protein